MNRLPYNVHIVGQREKPTADTAGALLDRIVTRDRGHILIVVVFSQEVAVGALDGRFDKLVDNVRSSCG